MNFDPQLPIRLDVTLNEAEGILAGLGELPSKSGAYGLLMKLQAQIESQLPHPVQNAQAQDVQATEVMNVESNVS